MVSSPPKGTNAKHQGQKGNPTTKKISSLTQVNKSQSAKLSLRQLRSLRLSIVEAKELSCNKVQGIQEQFGSTPSTSGYPDSQLKEFNTQLPRGFKIHLPGPQVISTNSAQGKVNMEGSNNPQNKGVISGRPSDIKIVAGGNKPAISTSGGYDQWQPVQSTSQGSNIVMKMLPGKKSGKQPKGKQNSNQPVQRNNLQPVQVQPKSTPPNPPSRSWTNITGHHLFPSPNNASYPKGVPKSFLKQQQRMEEQQNEQGIAMPNADNRPIWPTLSGFQPPTFTQTFTEAASNYEANTPMPGPTPTPTPTHMQSGSYSPTSGLDMFAEEEGLEGDNIGDGSESPSVSQKRLSAFQRLGPVAAPKKPKLTINLLFSKDDAVRRFGPKPEVVDGDAEQSKPADSIPVYERPDILSSTDATVIKYLAYWPWKNNVMLRRTAGPRTSKSVMMMEEEQMSEGYESNRHYTKVAISKFPSFYKKEDVLDLVLETANEKSLIPCFIEFTNDECYFLVVRSQKALLALHKKGLCLHENGYEMPIHISLTDLTVNNIGFIPRIVLGKMVTAVYDGEMKLNLEAFSLKSDISHFIYFPLNRPTNQAELIQLQSGVSWEHLRELNLANNRLTNIESFELARRCPKLKHLDLSNNFFEKVSVLLPCRGLLLSSLKLEGNPLCTDYTDPRDYVRVIKMIFPSLTELDGVKIPPRGDLPPIQQNYCPSDAKPLVDRLLSVYFSLLDTPPEERMPIEELYHENAVLSITYCYKLRFQPIFRFFRDLFTRCRLLEEENLDSVEGSLAIAKHISRWPSLKHDPFTFVVDVMHYDESNAIIRISGVFKVTSESLAEDEHLLCFTRTLVLRSLNGSLYKIHNEMVYWDAVSPEMSSQAFQITTLKPKKLSLKMDSAPDDDLKEKLIAIFMKVAQLNRKLSERCLEIKNWDFKVALEYYIKLLKLNSLDTLDVSDD